MFNTKKVKDDIVQWLTNYFNKPENKGVKAVIGISGGADSSIDAALCKEAIGAENVLGVLMPNGIQSDIGDAYNVVEHLGIPHSEINIKPVMDAFYKVLTDAGYTPNQLVYSNAPARIRSAVLFAITAIVRGRFINNGNKTESFLGWCTKGGDTVGDLAPLMNLVKGEVIAVGHETELLTRHVDKVPEDGLSGKSDEENFGFPYTVADEYIRKGIAEDMGVIAKIETMHERGLHKSEPIPSFPYNPNI